MKQDEAQRLTAKLFAAYDKPREKLTAAVYIERLLPLDHALALRAIDELIQSEKWMPSVASVLEVHHRLAGSALRSRSAALEEGDLTPEQKAEGQRRCAEILAMLDRSAVTRSVPSVTADDIAAERRLDEGLAA